MEIPHTTDLDDILDAIQEQTEEIQKLKKEIEELRQQVEVKKSTKKGSRATGISMYNKFSGGYTPSATVMWGNVKREHIRNLTEKRKAVKLFFPNENFIGRSYPTWEEIEVARVKKQKSK